MFAKLACTVACLFGLPIVSPALAGPSVAERVVMDYIAAWNVHDATRATGQLAYNVIYTGAGKSFAGREAAKLGMLGNIINAVPDGIWALSGENQIDEHNITLEWEISGTNTGIWPDGSAPSGKHVVLHGMSMFEVRDGKIANQADYYDRGG